MTDTTRLEAKTRRYPRRPAQAHTVVMEELRVQAMTCPVRGTVDRPGENVQGPVVYISQPCSRCGNTDKINRRLQAAFVYPVCGLAVNADHNAAVNILERHRLSVARGTGAAAR